MKIFSFNVNGIRARYHQLEKLISIHSPEVFCLQETKVHNDDFPHEEIDKPVSYTHLTLPTKA